MALISHKTALAVAKYEQAVEMGSSLACTSLANLLTRVDAAPLMSLAISPPSTSSRPVRPSLPPRQQSNVYAHAAHAHNKSLGSLRAAELYLKGLEIELRKPVPEEAPAIESGYGSAAEDEEGAEGRFFSRERALDLVVGVTDAHRYGVLHAPAPIGGPQLSERGRAEEKETTSLNDDLWERSAAAASALLAHPSISPVVESASSLPSTELPLSPSGSTRPPHKRRGSIARSYTHAASSIPDALPSGLTGSSPIPHLTPQRKVQLTIAIHALYTLALQSHSSAPAACCSHAFPSPPSHADAEFHWVTIIRLAAPYISQGGIGIKEGDELVSRAQHRLDTLRHQDQGANEPWRLAKLVKKPQHQHPHQHSGSSQAQAGPSQPHEPVRGIWEDGSVWEGEPASAMTIRPAADVGSVGTVVGSSFGGKTPRGQNGAAKFHFASTEEDVEEEDEEEQEEHEDEEHDDGPPHDLMVSTALHLDLGAPAAADKAHMLLSATQQYPSPPETPPVETGPQLHEVPLVPAFQRRTSAFSTTTLSPSSAAHPHSSTFFPSSTSASTSNLPRAASTYSFASYRSNTSVLSSFSHNPLQAYTSGRSRRGLRRVESSVSVCTAPPDFDRADARRWTRADKGKGRAVDAALSASTSSLPAPPAPKPDHLSVPSFGEAKSWVGRFWTSTKGAVGDLKASASSSLRECGLAPEADDKDVSAVDALRNALVRDEEAQETIMSYWGETEFVEDDEEYQSEEDLLRRGVVGEGDAVEIEAGTSKLGLASPPPPRRGASEATIRPTSSADAVVVAVAPPAHESALLRPPQLKRLDTSQSVRSGASGRSSRSKRSFLLEDPTSDLSPSDRRQHRRELSSSSANSSSASPSPGCSGFDSPPVGGGGGKKKGPVPIDPLLLELERRSHVGIKTTCATCHKKGLNFPTCRGCKRTYCTRACRVDEAHECCH
ncbi:hypothetical protein JCM8097_002016 [Rhodosporidiobolus ruineniae]